MLIEDIISRNFTAISSEYKQFAKEKDQCKNCSVYGHYKQVGQSEGNAESPTFLFIGEALGQDEAEQVRPFIGRAGQRLREELRKYPKVFNKKTTIISNVLPCRPKDNKFPAEGLEDYWIVKDGEKIPCKSRELVGHCVDLWLRREIEILKPKIVITLGAKSLYHIRSERGITSVRGSWKFLPAFQKWSMATYHPSYVLRCQNDPDKCFVPKQFIEDIKKIAQQWNSIFRNDQSISASDEELDRLRALSGVEE